MRESALVGSAADDSSGTSDVGWPMSDGSTGCGAVGGSASIGGCASVGGSASIAGSTEAPASEAVVGSLGSLGDGNAVWSVVSSGSVMAQVLAVRSLGS
jgi:hypothetical protein